MQDILDIVMVFLYIYTKTRGVILMTLYLGLEIRALVIVMSTTFQQIQLKLPFFSFYKTKRIDVWRKFPNQTGDIISLETRSKLTTNFTHI